ncbi:MAG: hypothetical protein ACRDJH_00595 [Thermomicrobiales bacterium]
MDSKQIDIAAKPLVTRVSRRRLLKKAGAIGVIGILGGATCVSAQDASAPLQAINEKRSQHEWLGNPLSDPGVSAAGFGWQQHFEYGSIYWTSATGAWELHGSIRD